MYKILLVAVSLAMLSGCSNPQPDLKSPCVGAEGSPCVRRPVNNHITFMHDDVNNAIPA
jgi:hypothetical protein